MAYKGNSGRGKSSSGRRSSGDDSAKRTWNQRTSHEDEGVEKKPGRETRGDDGGSERRPFKRSEKSTGFSKERKSYGDREKRVYVKRDENSGDAPPQDASEGRIRKPYAESGERKPYARKDSFKAYRDGGEKRERQESNEGDSAETRERKPYADRGERKPYARRDSAKDFREDGDKIERPSREGETGERPERKPYADRGERKPYARKGSYGDKKDFREGAEKRERPFTKEGEGIERRERKPYSDRGDRKPYPRKDGYGDRGERKPFSRDTNFRDKKEFTSREEFNPEGKPAFNRDAGGEHNRPYTKRTDDKRSYEKRDRGPGYDRKPLRKRADTPEREGVSKEKVVFTYPDGTVRTEKLTRLNKYLSNSGICSRREADELIKAGLVSVNGVIVTEMGVQVSRTDIVKYNNAAIRKERKVYVLLNKPKDFITTTDDPGERKTVMSLVENACKERIYPVGRLDRNTTGLLLVTNDGDLTKKLTHPSSNIKKIYHVELDKNLSTTDLKKIAAGIELEDGMIKVDEINYDGDGLDKSQVGIAIHSGKNRIVRRIFESLGYEVKKLDRVIFAGLTKKDLPRGRWRNLSEMEVNMLKMIAGMR